MSGVRADSPGTTVYTLGTPIDVILTARVSSESAHTGDPFYFKTAKDINLGTVDLVAGTTGSGRLATVVAATRNTPGELALQVDDLTSATTTVWINIDTSVTPRGHYATSRDIVLDPGTTFRVTTIAPRKQMAPLIETVTPTPEPASTAPVGPMIAPSATASSSPASSPVPSDSPSPSESMSPSESPVPSESPAPSESPSGAPLPSPSISP